MRKNYFQALVLGSLLTVTSAYTYGQEKDSVKVSNIEQVNITVGSRNKNKVATNTLYQ
jgi:iron complex outermembrane receptor protein